MLKLGGQLRIASGMTVRFLGWDMGAALALGDALGISRFIMAATLPEIEQIMIDKLNEQVTNAS